MSYVLGIALLCGASGLLLKPFLYWYLARRFGLTRAGPALVGPGVRVGLREEVSTSTDSEGRTSTSRTTYIDYRVDLKEAPPALKLQPESSHTGVLAAKGQRELSTGDVDFDDLLWVQCDEAGPAVSYLTQGRRQELVRAFWRLPSSEVGGRRFSGSQQYSSYGFWWITRTCAALAREIDVPKESRRLKGAGWVNRHQRLTVASWLLVLAVVPLGAGFGLEVWFDRPDSGYRWWGLAGASPFLAVALAYVLSLPGTTVLMRMLIRLMQLACVAGMVAAAWTQQLWAILPVIAALVWAFSLQRWYHHVGRIRTGRG